MTMLFRQVVLAHLIHIFALLFGPAQRKMDMHHNRNGSWPKPLLAMIETSHSRQAME